MNTDDTAEDVHAKSRARPIRSLLFCDPSSESDVRAAYQSGADGICFDLEEPHYPFTESERARALEQIAARLDEVDAGGNRPLIFVRVRELATGWTLRDLQSVVHPRLTGVLVPKVASARCVHVMDEMLRHIETERGLRPGGCALYPLLESAQALRNAYEIGTASTRVAYLGGAVSRFGDLHRSVGYRMTLQGEETLYIRSKALLDARAAGILWPLSGTWGGEPTDEVGFRAWATGLRNLGYYGMLLGNAALVRMANACFTPTTDELEHWRVVVRVAQAESGDARPGAVGPLVYPGSARVGAYVIHAAHVESAKANLQWAHELGITEDQE